MAIEVNEIPFNLLPEQLAFADDGSLEFALKNVFEAIYEILWQLKDGVGGASGIIPITSGGTGADTAAGARVNLGLEIGVDVQAWDSDLDEIAAIVAADDDVIIQVAGVWTNQTPAQFKALYELEIGVDIQAYSANLDEADTFFGATDISAAEAETLTDGSNADSLHVHTHTAITDFDLQLAARAALRI